MRTALWARSGVVRTPDITPVSECGRVSPLLLACADKAESMAGGAAGLLGAPAAGVSPNLGPPVSLSTGVKVVAPDEGAIWLAAVSSELLDAPRNMSLRSLESAL